MEKDIRDLLHGIKKELQFKIPSNSEHRLDLENLFQKQDKLKQELKEIEQNINKIGSLISEGLTSIYKYKSIYKKGTAIYIEHKLPDLDPYETSIYELYKGGLAGIQYKNLNDLNSAKFLTDDEKREILGLKPKVLRNND